MPDDIKPNSLWRFVKMSPHIILESHSHCEVPAGCGGVVLHWKNPVHGILALLTAFCPGESEYWLNGERIQHPQVLLVPGRNLLAIHVAKISGPSAGMMVHLEFDPAKAGRYLTGGPDTECPGQVMSCSDGSWKYSSMEIDEGWKGILYDDNHWNAMTVRTGPGYKEGSPGVYLFKNLQKQGAEFIGPVERLGEFWVRKIIDIPVAGSKS